MGTDSFQYNFNIPPVPETITKRNILADIQRLFDPLGWLGTAIVNAKMLIQKLWVEKLDWDEKVSIEIEEEWLKIRKSFEQLKKIHISRWLNTNNDEIRNITLHGFCDASNKGYCAVVYCRVETKNDEIKTGLVASKTRVAPIRGVTIPRLELLGAVLLANLLKQVRDAMRISKDNVYAWTDSSVVISWLFGDPNRWKMFVRNRVIEILDYTEKTQWYHVATEDNPADVGSRGIQLSQLVEHKLWWEGPDRLKKNNIDYRRPYISTTDLEKKKMIEVNLKVNEDDEHIKFENFDTLDELLRCIVYCKRFLNSWKKSETKTIISTQEIESSLITCIQIIQGREFGKDIEKLKKKGSVSKKSNIKTLNPYLDERNILRVGGRLRNTNLEDGMKHPIILGTKNYLVTLIIADAHLKMLHGGVQLMLGYLRSKYWILKAKGLVKAKIQKCLICAKQRATLRNQFMGDLPRVRVTPARAFLNSGVDFAGPFNVLASKGRGAKTNKAYVSIFICMATRAIHLELVGDLSSEAFIGAFRRFVSRRGKCTNLWSDQGRNFIGANKELVKAWTEAKLELEGNISNLLAKDGTEWHFIPGYSPHMGGLWEAGVKSLKYHMKRILTTNLTFEEMTTLLCQIEACLNSRPMNLIDNADIDNITPLTPGHFLIGEAPITIPNPDLRDVRMTHLSRWQYLQKLLADLWHRWQQEYLSRLQQRPKWLRRVEEFEIGQIVLIKTENLPPGKWALGRILKKHPSADGITRVYSVKSGNSVVQRPMNRLCYLPIDIE